MKLFFIVFALIVWSILFCMHWLVYATLSRVFSVSIPNWTYILSFLSISYILASFGVRMIQSRLTDWFYFIASTWLGFVFLFFSVVLVYTLVHVLTGIDSKVILSCLLSLALLSGIYALVQGRTITTRTYTISLENLSNPLRIVHLSDIHVGTVHQKKYLKEIVERANDLNPDIVLITGDLFDGSANIDTAILTPLNNLNARSFFSNGNHEEYEGLDKVRETLKGLDLELLENESVEYKGVSIVGVNDKQSLHNGNSLASILESLSYDKNTPTLLMYHTPVDWDTAKSHDIDVMFSGHTHNGQLFPFTLLVRIAFSKITGLYSNDGKYLHISPGTGTWGPPMRLGSRNQITLIELSPHLP